MSKKHNGKSNKQDMSEETVVEQLRKQRARANRLARENKRLRTELKKRGSVEADFQDLLEELPTEEQIKKEVCEECGKGVLETISIGGFNFIRCNLCSFQRREK